MLVAAVAVHYTADFVCYLSWAATSGELLEALARREARRRNAEAARLPEHHAAAAQIAAYQEAQLISRLAAASANAPAPAA